MLLLVQGCQCGVEHSEEQDAGSTQPRADAAADAAWTDTLVADGWLADSSEADSAAPSDAAALDAGTLDGATAGDARLADVPVAADSALPDTSLPDGLLPDGLLPDTSLPDTSLPDTSLPDTSLPDTLLPDTLLPDTLLPDSAPTTCESAEPCYAGVTCTDHPGEDPDYSCGDCPSGLAGDGEACTEMVVLTTCPGRAVLGDFDGDADLDIAVPHWAGHVSILRNHGASSVVFHAQHSAGSGTRNLFAAHLDADANIDLAALNVSSYNISALLGDGAGDFAAAVNYDTGLGEVSGATACLLDGDAFIDIAIATGTQRKIWMLRGNGTGGFLAKQQRLDMPNHLGGVACADFGSAAGVNDDNMDLAYAHPYPDISAPITEDEHIGVMLGNGTGSFPDRVTNEGPWFRNGRRLEAADLNGDGFADVVATMGSFGYGVAYMRGIGDGRLMNYISIGAGTLIDVGDVDGDGNGDIAYQRDGGRMHVALGDGAGAFSDQPYPFMNVTGIAFADLDNSGGEDVVLSICDSQNGVVVLWR